MNFTSTTVSACRSFFPDISNLPKSQRLTIFIFQAFLIPVTIVSNSVVLVGLTRTKSSGSKLLIISLCITDLLVGGLLLPLMCAHQISSTMQTSCIVRFAVLYLAYTFLSLDFLIALGIGIERLIVLKYPLQHLFFRWESARKYILLCMIFFVLVMASATVLVAEYMGSASLFNLLTLVIILVLSAILVSSYSILYHHVRNSVNKLYSGKNNCIKSRSKQLRHDVALARSVTVILCFQLSMWTPYFIASLYWRFQKSSEEQLTGHTLSTFIWTFLPLFTNSSANAFIYSYYNRPLRQYLAEKYSYVFRFIPGRRKTSKISKEQQSTKKTKESNV